jgi:hypothetical protein
MKVVLLRYTYRINLSKSCMQRCAFLDCILWPSHAFLLSVIVLISRFHSIRSLFGGPILVVPLQSRDIIKEHKSNPSKLGHKGRFGSYLRQNAFAHDTVF